MKLGSPHVLGAMVAAVALTYRLILLRTVLPTTDSDQAVSGIMSLHILQGDRPVFFYGQSYDGALEQYLTAGVFRLFGTSDFTLRLVPALASTLLAVQLYALARRLYGPRVAAVTGLWIAVPPPVLAVWSLAAGAGYIGPTVIGTAMIIIAIRRWWLRSPRSYDIPALGLLAGLGLWLQPMIADYYLALACAGLPLLWGNRARLPRLASRRGPVLVACFLVGAAPWLAYVMGHGLAGTLAALSRPLPAAPLGDVLHRLVSESWPVLIGAAQPTGYPEQFRQYVYAHPWPYAPALLLLALLAVRLVLSPHGWPSQARAMIAGRPCADAPLAVLPLVVLGLYLASDLKNLAWTTGNPRYLMPLYTAAPYLMACLLPEVKAPRGTQGPALTLSTAAVRSLRPLAALIAGAAIAFNAYAEAHIPDLPSGVLPDVAPLAQRLAARGDGAVYGDYWVIWRLAFAWHERLIPVDLNGLAVDRRPRGARFPPYLARAGEVGRWAFIIPRSRAPSLITLLRRYRVPYQMWRWGTSSLFYYHWDWGQPVVLDGPVRPDVPFILAAGRPRRQLARRPSRRDRSRRPAAPATWPTRRARPGRGRDA